MNTREYEALVDEIATVYGWVRTQNMNSRKPLPTGLINSPDREYVHPQMGLAKAEVKFGADVMTKGQMYYGVIYLTCALNNPGLRYGVLRTIEDAQFLFGPEYDAGMIELK